MLKMRNLFALVLALIMFTAAMPALATDMVDYAGHLALNMGSETSKTTATVHTYVDGDTVHFDVPASVSSTGVLKARFLAVNTPESTGKIEEWGKKAAAFTKEKLSQATSIILESDTAGWNLDSTGSRHLVWVWYKTAENEPYRNLNIEILQNGLAIANATANNRYGSLCMAALNYARESKLHIYSGQKDPGFYYGDAVELTLKELRCNLDKYNGIKVAFNGIITLNDDNSVYIEEYDAETDMYYGMAVYYGFNLSGAGLDILSVGNEARIVGTLQYYEAGGTWQVSGLNYRMMKPKDPGNIQKLSDGHQPAYVPTDAEAFANGKVQVTVDDEILTFDYAALAMSTTLEMKNLTVTDVYTTTDPASSSLGAVTISTVCDGTPVMVRTVPLYNADGSLITEDAYRGKTIDVRGVVDYFNGAYQIKVLMPSGITIHE